jgi:hypothetical protein
MRPTHVFPYFKIIRRVGQPIARHNSLKPITTVRTMATSNNNTLQSDITKMKAEKDGSFKRADASFRNVIEKGGHFEPQPGAELF